MEHEESERAVRLFSAINCWSKSAHVQQEGASQLTHESLRKLSTGGVIWRSMTAPQIGRVLNH
jgi:hypothetical protein